MFTLLQTCLVVSNCLCLHLQAKLQPSDDITVYYKTSGGLAKVVPEYSEFIFGTIKQPLVPYPVPAGAEVITKENAKVSTCNVLQLLITSFVFHRRYHKMEYF